MLFSNFGPFTNIYGAMMRSYVQSGITSLGAATTDVNQTHITMKLWLMLANSMSTVVPGGESLVASMWNELWAAYEGFLDVLEMEAQVGQYPVRYNPCRCCSVLTMLYWQTLIALASTSIADVLMYMRSVKTSLALETSSHITILNRLKTMVHSDASSSKVCWNYPAQLDLYNRSLARLCAQCEVSQSHHMKSPPLYFSTR